MELKLIYGAVRSRRLIEKGLRTKRMFDFVQACCKKRLDYVATQKEPFARSLSEQSRKT